METKKTWLEVSLNGPWGRAKQPRIPVSRERDRRARRGLCEGRCGHRPRARLRRGDWPAEGRWRAVRTHHRRASAAAPTRSSTRPSRSPACRGPGLANAAAALRPHPVPGAARPAGVGGGRSGLGQLRLLRRAARGQSGIRVPEPRGAHPLRAWTWLGSIASIPPTRSTSRASCGSALRCTGVAAAPRRSIASCFRRAIRSASLPTTTV